MARGRPPPLPPRPPPRRGVLLAGARQRGGGLGSVTSQIPSGARASRRRRRPSAACVRAASARLDRISVVLSVSSSSLNRYGRFYPLYGVINDVVLMCGVRAVKSGAFASEAMDLILITSQLTDELLTRVKLNRSPRASQNDSSRRSRTPSGFGPDTHRAGADGLKVESETLDPRQRDCGAVCVGSGPMWI
ncbi:hypothetical protein EVAR_37584_1 [Eumeta japonica]|uniref:Uncharacterized protein n=1 Tax=Eumeta variegata TaxID=151549 RepID=A0A4C1VNA2_EUMVA|nr:hypothetical protein EVAR_37584_1 [Eumeta japonica]